MNVVQHNLRPIAGGNQPLAAVLAPGPVLSPGARLQALVAEHSDLAAVAIIRITACLCAFTTGALVLRALRRR